MSSSPSKNATPIQSRADLVAWLEQGCKPKSNWRIGTEHEKFGFRLDDHRPLPFVGEMGIEAILKGLQRFDWQPVFEGDDLISLYCQGATITLEPGGQLELSGAPLEDLHQTCDEVHRHLDQVKAVASELGAGFLGMGFHPTAAREDIPWMPKKRYQIMREYMPTVGSKGIDMMKRTCTIQTNLDFSSEADMVKKFRVSMALQPVMVALYANSPFTEGKPNGYLSYRSACWLDTDPDRSGTLPFVFEEGMGFERYVDYMLDVPMYFVNRNTQLLNVAGQSFRDFLKGELPGFPGEKPTMADWEDHLTTAFPEVRLKRFLEMRGADGGPWSVICALPAFWVGILYDSESLDAAWDLVKHWTPDDHAHLRTATPKTGLATKVAGETLQDIAQRCLVLAEAGLNRRNRTDRKDQTETRFLEVLHKIAETGHCPAYKKLKAYHGRWNDSVEPVFKDFAY